MWLIAAWQDRYELLKGPLKTHFEGDSCVFGSGVFRYWRMAHCRESVSRPPLGVVLSVMIRLMDFTPISALQFGCGNATDDRRWCTPHSLRNWRMAVAVNSGPPSERVVHLVGKVRCGYSGCKFPVEQ